MQLLLRLLSKDDAIAAEALRVLKVFNSHSENLSSLAEIARSVADLSHCRVTIRDAVGRIVSRDCSDGWPEGYAGGFVIRQDFGPQVSPVGTVCIETDHPASVIDRFVLDCAAYATERVFLYGQLDMTEQAGADRDGGRARMTTALLMDTALRDEASEGERLRAVRLLNLPESKPLQVAVAESQAPLREVVRAIAALEDQIAVSILEGTAVVIASTSAASWSGLTHMPGLRIGISSEGSAEHLPMAHGEAQTALSFTHQLTAAARVARWDELGAFAMLTAVPTAVLSQYPDVRVLLELSDSESGLYDIAIAENFCAEGTLRSAAAVLHLHHSSVARGLARLQDQLGFNPADPARRGRLQAALAGWRLVLRRQRISMRDDSHVPQWLAG